MKVKWPFSSQNATRDMSEEMAFHIESRSARARQRRHERSRRALEARRRFGSVLKQKEAGHEIHAGRFFEMCCATRGTWDAVCDAPRALRLRSCSRLRSASAPTPQSSPWSTSCCCGRFRIPTVENLVMVYEAREQQQPQLVSPATWLDWQRDNHTLERVAAWMSGGAAILTGAGEAARLGVQPISADFFPLLRVPPMLGRIINEDDDRPNAPAVAVISHHLWQTRFGGDRNVVGRFIQLDDTPRQVVA
jgi:hypothetical protein